MYNYVSKLQCNDKDGCCSMLVLKQYLFSSGCVYSTGLSFGWVVPRVVMKALFT